MSLFIRLIHCLQLRIHFQSLVQGNVQLVRYQLRDKVALCVRYIKNTSHVAYNSSCRKGTEGYDLGNAVLSILLCHIIYDILSSLIFEVHIHIGHSHTFRIQETLKDETVSHGVDVGDAYGVGNDGAGSRTSSGTYGNVMGFGIMDVIPDDKEVVNKAHGSYGVKLVSESVLIL